MKKVDHGKDSIFDAFGMTEAQVRKIKDRAGEKFKRIMWERHEKKLTMSQTAERLVELFKGLNDLERAVVLTIVMVGMEDAMSQVVFNAVKNLRGNCSKRTEVKPDVSGIPDDVLAEIPEGKMVGFIIDKKPQ